MVMVAREEGNSAPFAGRKGGGKYFFIKFVLYIYRVGVHFHIFLFGRCFETAKTTVPANHPQQLEYLLDNVDTTCIPMYVSNE